MNKKIIMHSHCLLILALFCVYFQASYAYTLPDLKSSSALNQTTNHPSITPKSPKIDAAAYILVDADSGKVLAEHESNLQRPPASLTKLMTLYVAADALKTGRIKLDDQVRISEKAWRTGGSRMFVKVGSTVSVDNLIHGVATASGNDACVALSEHIGGSEDAFTVLMNQQAKILGMNASNFTDSTGMPHPDHYTTAHDIAVLSRAFIKNQPEYYNWFNRKWFTYNDIKQPNRNRLLWRDPTVDGLKTGHTKAAGYCLVSSAKRKGMRLISVVLGAPSDKARAEDSQRLLTFGFRFFETHHIYQAGDVLNRPRVWKGKFSNVPVGIADDLYVTIPIGQYQSLKPSLVINNIIQAPIKKGQPLGSINIKLNDTVVMEQPLVALQDDPAGNIFKRMYDSVRMTFHGWFSDESKG